MADYKDFAAAKSAAPVQQQRETLIDWGRVGDALRSTTRRASDAAIDAALQRPAPPPPAAPIVVRDAGSSSTALYVLIGLGVVGLAIAATRR